MWANVLDKLLSFSMIQNRNTKTRQRGNEKWLLNHLRWGGFGTVAGILGSILISLDAGYLISYMLTLSPFRYSFMSLYAWFARDFDFFQVFILAVVMGALSLIEVRVLMPKIPKEIVEESGTAPETKRLLKIRNSLAGYIFAMSAVCITLFAILNLLGQYGLR
jgi:hypothetical protein